MRSLSFIASFILFSAISQSVMAGERMDYDVSQVNSQERITLYLQGTQARISSSADSSSALIFNAEEREIHILDHSAKTITTLDQASLEQLASIAMGMGELSKSQGGVLGDIMKTFGFENDLGANAQIETKTLGGEKIYSGQACQTRQIYRDGALSTQICLAPDLRMQAAEKKTLDSLIDFAQLMLRQGQIVLAQFNMPIPLLSDEPLDGTPVFIDDLNSKTTATLVAFKKLDVLPRQFALPEGYSRRTLSL